MKLTPVNLLQLAIALQGVVLAIFLLARRRGKRVSNSSLGAMLLLLAAHMVSNVRGDLGLLGPGIPVAQLGALLYGPLFFLYVRGPIHRHSPLGWADLAHPVPLLLALAFRVNDRLTADSLALLIFSSIGFYLAHSLAALADYRGVLRQTRSDLDRLKLTWLQQLILVLGAIWVLDVASYFVSIAGRAEIERGASTTVFVLLLVFVTVLTFKGLAHPEIFSGITAEDQALLVESEDAEIGPDDEGDATRLVELMEKERPFLDPGLTLASLATMSGLSARRVSRLINSTFGRNFCEFVNSYRVEEAKRRLASPAATGETILDTLLAVGFNSKSAANAAFKQATGVTPTEFQRSHRE